jgi:uncharacterized protein YcaQ
MILSREDLRTAFLIRQGLTNDPAWKSVQEAISQICAVQIDAISVVARSHHLTLRHRVQSYDFRQLWKSLFERELIEYYVHGNSFVPIEYFPFLRHCMKRFQNHGYKWIRDSITKYQDIMKKILLRIKDEGPLKSRDFKDAKKTSDGWWDWKPSKHAIELLWWTGHIVVVNRQGFERVYDVTERGIPSKYLDLSVSKEEVWRFFLRQAVDCLVVATISDIRDYFNFHIYSLDKGESTRKTLLEKIQTLKQEGDIVEVKVEDDSTPHYILNKNIGFIEEVQNYKGSHECAFFLSPFDNVVWDRKRVRRLFNLDVRLESYIPKAKRKFGYFTMPIIWNNRIIGRLDPKVDRKSRKLILANIELILSKKNLKNALEAINKELTAFKTFHGCEQIEIKKAKPAKLKNLFH